MDHGLWENPWGETFEENDDSVSGLRCGLSISAGRR